MHIVGGKVVLLYRSSSGGWLVRMSVSFLHILPLPFTATVYTGEQPHQSGLATGGIERVSDVYSHMFALETTAARLSDWSSRRHFDHTHTPQLATHHDRTPFEFCRMVGFPDSVFSLSLPVRSKRHVI